MPRFKPASSVKLYKYGVFSQHHEDEYVAQALMSYDPELYKSLQGYTKKGANAYEVTKILKEYQTYGQNNDREIDFHHMVAIQHAIKAFDEAMGEWKVEPLDLDEAIDKLHLDKSAGYGYPGMRKGDVIEELRADVKAMMVDIISDKPVDILPCLLGSRAKIREEASSKRRITFMMPGAGMILEQMFAGPFYEKAKTQGILYLGKDVLPRLSLESLASGGRGYVMRSDLTTFDARVISPLLTIAFDWMEARIDFTKWKGKPVGLAQQKRYKRLWEYVKYYFFHTPVMTPQGDLEWLDGMVISGSGFTQFIDSIVSALYTYTCAWLEGNPVEELRVLGDDVRVWLASRPDRDHWQGWMLEIFGAVLSVAKTRVQKKWYRDKGFLGYEFVRGFLFRPEKEFFLLALYSSRKVKDVDTSYSRLLAYMHLGGVGHVGFTNFFMHYQSGWPIGDGYMKLDHELMDKVKYAGLRMEVKPMREFTMHDFLYGLITFKHKHP